MERCRDRRRGSGVGRGLVVLLGLATAGWSARELAERAAPEVSAALMPGVARAERSAAATVEDAPAPVPRRLAENEGGARAPIASELPPERARPEDLKRWIDDLAHDDVRGNAQHALRQLRRAGERARAPLERALHSLDHQQRQLAAHLLQRFDGEPSQQLLFVSLEGLRHDRLPADPAVGLGFCNLSNARRSASFLVEYAPRVEMELLGGLQAADGQERLLCAYVLAAARRTRALERTTQVLIEHLADNEVRGDAVLATSALYQLGEAGLPFVRHAIPGADKQARGLLKLVELDVRSPPRGEWELRKRHELHDATTGIPDPAVQCDVNTGGIVTWGDALSRDAGLGPRYGVVR